MSFKETNATLFSLWERAFQSYQHTREWTLQLIDFQLEATSTLTPSPLQRKLFTALTRISIQANKGNTPPPIDFTDLIEAVFVNQGVPKLRKNGKWLIVNLNSRMTV
jgi:hypothetical protein